MMKVYIRNKIGIWKGIHFIKIGYSDYGGCDIGLIDVHKQIIMYVGQRDLRIFKSKRIYCLIYNLPFKL